MLQKKKNDNEFHYPTAKKQKQNKNTHNKINKQKLNLAILKKIAE